MNGGKPLTTTTSLPEHDEADERADDRAGGRQGLDGGRFMRRPSSAVALAEVAPDLARRRETTASSRSASDRGRGSSTGMSATTRPGRGDRTTIRSATRIASGMLWVTRTIVVAGALPEAEQLEVEALAGERVERAERLVEEEHLGLERERRASATRCWVPPDSSDGRLSTTPGSSATSSGSSAEALPAALGRPAGELERVGDVVGGRAPRQEARLLEDEADARVRAVDRRAVERDAAPIRRSRPAMTRRSVDLPLPLGPMRATMPPAGTPGRCRRGPAACRRRGAGRDRSTPSSLEVGGRRLIGRPRRAAA